MKLLKSILTWATVWTVVIVVAVTVRGAMNGEPFSALNTLLLTVVVWVFAVGFMVFYKILGAARQVGTNLGRAAVENPKGEAGQAVAEAVDDALRKTAGVDPVGKADE
jgi:hypothetical protein